MRTAEQTLETLGTISEQHPDYVFHRVYRELFNRDLLLRAYLKLAPNEGNMTKGTDGKTIDGFGMELVDDIVGELRSERFYPKPVRREYIPKANGKLRPLGIPTFKDKLVAEGLKELLEAIYEPLFLDCSHGFRPGRSCHTALSSIRYRCKGANWVIEGDLSAFFDNIDHSVLLKLLQEKIDDGRIIELVRRFLKAGYVEDGSFNETTLGSPQGSVVSPLLANVYLHELDKFVEGLKSEYERGTCRKQNPEYGRLRQQYRRYKAIGDMEKADTFLKQMRMMPSSDPMDEGFVRLNYYRYADDWCVFICGSKELAKDIKERISTFLKFELKLELNESKTHITNLKDESIRFLGYEVAKIHNDSYFTTNVNGRTYRSRNGYITLRMPQDAIKKRFGGITKNGKPAPRDDLLEMSVEGIVWTYASEVNGVYNYYCLASNVARRMNQYKRVHYASMLRTIAKKEKSSVRKVLSKYGKDLPRADGRGTHLVFCVMDGNKRVAWYPYEGFPKKAVAPVPKDVEIKEFGKELRERILANRCEVCGSSHRVEVHHVRNLEQTWERYSKRNPIPDWVHLMKRMRRKTLVLCHDCHVKLHSNKLFVPSVHGEARCAERRTSGFERGGEDTRPLLYKGSTAP